MCEQSLQESFRVVRVLCVLYTSGCEVRLTVKAQKGVASSFYAFVPVYVDT